MINNYKEAFEKTRAAGLIAAGALDEVSKIAKPGISTDQIDKLCYDYISDHGAYSAPLFYRGFPKSCCTSANHVVCHGIPSDKILYEGDIVNVDITVIKDGYHGDTSKMFYIGKPSVQAKRLTEITYEALKIGIKTVKPGNTLGDIGFNIQKYVEENNIDISSDAVKDYAKDMVKKQMAMYGQNKVDDEELNSIVERVTSNQDELKRIYSMLLNEKILNVFKNKMTKKESKVDYKKFIETAYDKNV